MKTLANEKRRKGFSAAMAFLTAYFLLAAVTPGSFSHAAGSSGPVAMVPIDFVDLARDASPAVVNISTVKTVEGRGRVFDHFFKGPRGGNDPFDQFFDRFFDQFHEREYRQRSLGSGFIIDKAGYIVTNHHVIKDADAIVVKLEDGKEYDAEIIGTDSSTDLALIKIDAEKDLPFLKLGDSDKVEVGEWVLAIGNPFGLDHTVTSGIVSAKGRFIGAGQYDDFLQTDASINPGNSGGPLLDMDGMVVGINTAIVAGGDGIGFAIPASMAENIIKQLRESGTVVRGWLGVGIQDLDADLKEYYGIDHGVLVTEVLSGQPAEEAGIKANDIIVSVNGKTVNSARNLSRMVSGLSVGEKAEIEVFRDGNTRKIDVTIGRQGDDTLAGAAQPAEALGIRVAGMTPEIARRLNMRDVTGVIVEEVEPGSVGARAGIRVGDVILEANRMRVESPSDFSRIIGELGEKDPIQLFIRRAQRGYMVITIRR
ncbi:MAG: DegQ family serine endoprotease [Desulfosalsimonadaceae bacterium]